MAFKADLRKIMLTCFKHNPAAQKFFKTALKYEIDETCPIDDVYEQHDYEVILYTYSYGVCIFFLLSYTIQVDEIDVILF